MKKKKTKAPNTISGQFAPRLIEMLRSPAWRTLSLSARRILDRIEIELASHGGRDNGKLPVTYANFVEFSVHRLAIAPGIREACALGLLEVTRRGRSGNGEFRRPTLFRLPYLPAYGKGPTHEWRRIKTLDEAAKIAKKVRRTIKKTTPGKRTGTGTENVPKTTPGKRTEAPNSPHPENVPLSRQGLSISPVAGLRQDHPQHQGGAPRRAARARDGDPVTFHRTNKRRTS